MKHTAVSPLGGIQNPATTIKTSQSKAAKCREKGKRATKVPGSCCSVSPDVLYGITPCCLRSEGTYGQGYGVVETVDTAPASGIPQSRSKKLPKLG